MYPVMGAGQVAPQEIVSARIAQVLSAFPQVEGGYLFGSCLEREDFRDIDVALRFSEAAGSPAVLRKLASRIGREMEKALSPRREVDVRILNASPVAFQHAVVKRGKSVFVPDEARRIRYEAALLSAYLDYQETLEWFDRRFLVGIR